MAATLDRAWTVLRGLVYSASFVGLWAWLAVAVRRYDGALLLEIPGWLRPAGLAVVALGALLCALCVATFVTVGHGTPAPFDPPRTFVASGPYRYVRNPMYLGAVGVLVGTGLALPSPSIVLLGLAFLVLAHLMVVLYEEPSLRARFGDGYAQYTRSVHRWRIRRPARTVPPAPLPGTR